MIIGGVIGFAGAFLSVMIATFCYLSMENILRHLKKISIWDFIFPIKIVNEYKQLLKERKNNRKLNYLALMNWSLITAPVILLIGLLVMVIGKSL